jgi:hypothetical protein
MDVNIRYFDPSKMSRTASVLLLGRRGSGKSTMAEEIMRQQTHIKEGICVSPTDCMTNFWRRHMPPLFIHHDYESGVIEEFLNHQERKWLKYKRECKQRGEEPEEGRVEQAFIICDDVTYDKSFFKNKATRRLYMNGRHYSVFSLVTCQYLMDIGPDLRGQIDYVFILKETGRDTLERLYQYFAGSIFPTQTAFEETLRALTENRECMVIDNTVQSYNISDCVFFFKARQGLEFRLGGEDYWRIGTENYVSDDEGSDDPERGARDYYAAGRSKKDQDMAKRFHVTKVYPGPAPVAAVTPFRAHAPAEYAHAYRASTVSRDELRAPPSPPRPAAPPRPKKVEKAAKATKKAKKAPEKKKKKKASYRIDRIEGVLG